MPYREYFATGIPMVLSRHAGGLFHFNKGAAQTVVGFLVVEQREGNRLFVLTQHITIFFKVARLLWVCDTQGGISNLDIGR